MITSITIQTQMNKNYKSAFTVKTKLLGDRFTTDLETELNTHLQLIKLCGKVVTELNKDLLTCRIAEKMTEITGYAPIITHKTKHKRTYFWSGLTVHEEDQTM